MNEWQPIETAPKDRRILLLCPKRGMVMGKWDKDVSHQRRSYVSLPYWTNDQSVLFGVLATRADQPTHWMLPELPE